MISSVRRSQIFEKKYRRPNLGPTGLNQAQNEVLRNFLEFGSLVFFEIAYNDNLQQCLTYSRGKSPWKKMFGTQIWTKRAKISPGISFFCHFRKFCTLVFLEIAYIDSLQQCLKSSRGIKLTKKILGPKYGPKLNPKLVQNWAWNLDFHHFLKFTSLVFVDIAQYCNFGQCLTSSRAEVSRKKLRPKVRPNSFKLGSKWYFLF